MCKRHFRVDNFGVDSEIPVVHLFGAAYKKILIQHQPFIDCTETFCLSHSRLLSLELWNYFILPRPLLLLHCKIFIVSPISQRNDVLWFLWCSWFPFILICCYQMLLLCNAGWLSQWGILITDQTARNLCYFYFSSLVMRKLPETECEWTVQWSHTIMLVCNLKIQSTKCLWHRAFLATHTRRRWSWVKEGRDETYSEFANRWRVVALKKGKNPLSIAKFAVWSNCYPEQFLRPLPLNSWKRGKRRFRHQNILDLPYPP